jgi:hypothetical protein
MWRIIHQSGYFVPVHLITLLALVATALGDTRCFCNLSQCVQTGYMCKSVGPNAACYSEYLGPKLSDVHHGCIEKLPLKLHDICGQSAEVARESGSQRLLPSRFPSLLCCQNDMCNYVGKLDMNIMSQHQSNQSKDSYDQSSQAHSWPDMWWFKVAVIAVPTVLSFVLVALVLLARQLLRQGTKRHHRQDQQIRKQRQGQFMPPDLLLMTSNSCDVPLKSTPCSKPSPDVDHNQIYSRTTGNFAQQSTFRPFLSWPSRPGQGLNTDLTLV